MSWPRYPPRQEIPTMTSTQEHIERPRPPPPLTKQPDLKEGPGREDASLQAPVRHQRQLQSGHPRFGGAAKARSFVARQIDQYGALATETRAAINSYLTCVVERAETRE